MKLIAQQVATLNQEDIQLIEKNGEIPLTYQNKSINLLLKEVEISSQDIEGWQVASAGSLTVALDIDINEELRREGIARELVNRIQNMRKDSGFEVTDKITVSILKDGTVEEAVSANLDYIKTETLTATLHLKDKMEEGTSILFDEIDSKLLIQKN